VWYDHRKPAENQGAGKKNGPLRISNCKQSLVETRCIQLRIFE